MLVLGLVQNIALLVTLSVVQLLLLRRWEKSRPGYHMLSGVLYGSVAIAGMTTAITVAPGIMFDGRSIVLAVGGFIGGPFVAAIAAVMAVAYRVYLGGAGTITGVSVILTSALLGVGAYYLRHRTEWVARPLGLWLVGLLVHALMVALMMTLPDDAWRVVLPQIAFPVLVFYPVATLLVARITLDGEARIDVERALRESEARMRAIIEQTDQGVSLGKPDGTITLYNPAMERLSGYSRAEVEEHGWFDLVYPTEERRAEAVRIATEAIEGGWPYVEIPIVRKDGVERWVSFATSPVTIDGEAYNLSILTDITDQRQAEERLRELESIVSRSPAVAFTWEYSEGWPILFVSSSIEKYGHDPEALMRARTPHAQLMHPDDVPRIERELAASMGQGAEEFDGVYRLRTRSGEYRWMAEHTWTLPTAAGGPALLQGVLVDTHDRKLAELELQRHRVNLEDLVIERTEELIRVNRELEEASQAKSQLLANMSHELRTPMNSIIGFSGILTQGLAGPLNEEQTQQVKMINRSGRQLLGLINDILDLAKVEAGGIELHFEWFDPCELLRETAAAIAPLADEKGLAIATSIEGRCKSIYSDPAKVRQILVNLAGNAVKFTEAGSVTVSVAPGPDSGVTFTVSDSGPGITEDDLGRIFEAFTQGRPAESCKPAGTGLGLTISQEFARMLGGEITVTSVPGTGSVFTLRLPPDSKEGHI